MDSKLYQAVISGDLNVFQTLKTEYDHIHGISSSSSSSSSSILLQVTNGQKNTILHLAAKYKQKQISENIINSYPSLIYHKNSKGDTPLHISSRIGCVEIVKLLTTGKIQQEVEEGQEKLLKMANMEGDNAMHDAVRNGHFEVLKLLLKEDPELACTANNYGESPLFLAVDRRFFDIASYILLHASNYSCAGRNNMNALHAAIIRTCNGQLIDSLFDLWVQHNYKPSRFFYQTITSIKLTCERLNHKLFYQLQEKLCTTEPNIEADVMTTIIRQHPNAATQFDELGWTPLHYAAHFSHTKAVEMLLKDNNMNITYLKDTQEGMSALHIAANAGNVMVMKQLVTHCPEVCEVLDNRNRTALHVAVESGKADAVKYLLGTVAFEGLINEQDTEGNTALHVAAVHGHLGIVNMLADEGRVEKGAINKKGLVAIEIILSKKELRHFQKAWITKKLAKGGGPPSLKGVIARTTKPKDFKMNGHAPHIEEQQLNSREETVEGKDVKVENKDAQFKCGKDVGNTHLLVATIIATVTFSAGFQMPGGLDRGMAISSRKLAFKTFLVADTIAFCCSAASMLLHFWASTEKNCSVYQHFLKFASALTYNSIIGMVTAFISGTNVVFAESSFIATINLVIGCCFFTIFFIWFFR